jgi:transcriptional antiterminator
MIPVTQRLIEESNTRKLATKERRQAVVFIRSTNPEVTNTEMAEQFGVSERTIRQDLQAFRREKAQFIKDDDVGLIIADIALGLRAATKRY